MAPGLEAMSRTDGAWYDVYCKRSRVRQDGKLVIRFRPVEDFQCRDLSLGLPVCALAKFPKTGDERWMDAEVVDICAVDHTGEEECSCQFKVRWIGVEKLAASEIDELKIQDPCWVRIERICNLEAGTHLDHPVIVKWKRAMIYSSHPDNNPISPSTITKVAGSEIIEDHPNHPAIRVEGSSDEYPSTSSSQSPEKQYLQPLPLFTNGSEDYQDTAYTRKRTVALMGTVYSEEAECKAHKKRMLDNVPWRETDPIDSNKPGDGQPGLDKSSAPTDMVAWRVGKLFGIGSDPPPIQNTDICTKTPSAPYVYEDDTIEKISFLTDLWKEGYPGSLEDENLEEDSKCLKDDSPVEKNENATDLPLFPNVPTRPRSNIVRRSRFKKCFISDRSHPNQSYIASQSCMIVEEPVLE